MRCTRRRLSRPSYSGFLHITQILSRGLHISTCVLAAVDEAALRHFSPTRPGTPLPSPRIRGPRLNALGAGAPPPPSRRTASILSTMLLSAEEDVREASHIPACETRPRSVRRRCGTTLFSTSPYRARTPCLHLQAAGYETLFVQDRRRGSGDVARAHPQAAPTLH